MDRQDDKPDEMGLNSSEGQTWQEVLEEMRKTRRKQFLRVSRKMLNHLCSIGLPKAQAMLAEVDAWDPTSSEEENSPKARHTLEASALMEGAPFEMATEYLVDEEILNRINKWQTEDKARYFSTVVGDSRSTMPEIADAIRHYDDVLRGRSGLALSTLKSLRVSLIQRFLTEQLDYIIVAKEVAMIVDFRPLLDRITMTEGCMGKLGGKAAGLLLAKWILDQPDVQDMGFDEVKTPRTWHLISDAIMDFINLNSLDDVQEQKFKEINQVRREYPNLIQLFKNSTFPSEVIIGLSRALDYFGEVPLIIRSSSLLEDRFGTAFSGKYKSLFLPNQGTKAERLDAIMDAVAEVWASVLGPDPIEYRRERGLQEFVEEMGILIQEVVGTRVGKYWMPAFSGVAFSQNEFRWSPRIKREDGLVRLVPGLGTRAVDRVGDDFPILAVPGQPGLRPSVSVSERLRYTPNKADVINLETQRFESVELKTLLKESGADYPLLDKVFSVFKDGRIQKSTSMRMDPENDDLVADMEGLLTETSFITRINTLLETLQEHLGSPVDIEFAHDGKDFYLLQCRPQAQTGDVAPAPIPRDTKDKDFIFNARRFVSNGWVPDISHIVYVDPEAYGQLSTEEEMRRVGRAVGLLNQMLPKRRFILMGPGRWGSRGDIKLGVNVTYSDINNTAVLIEIARRKGNYVPDLSFGTHFFQDLVEAQIRYLPLYPDDEEIVFNEKFLTSSSNMMPGMIPDYADLASCLRVVDVAAERPGQVMRLFLNADQDEAVAVLQDADDEGPVAISEVETPAHKPLQYWRWRFRMAEKLVRSLDAKKYGVEAVYLYGSVQDGTAVPSSDVDLLLHFNGTEEQKCMIEQYLEGWSKALTEMNLSRAGIKVDPMLDVTFVTDEEIARGKGLAGRINAVTNPARKLEFS